MAERQITRRRSPAPDVTPDDEQDGGAESRSAGRPKAGGSGGAQTPGSSVGRGWGAYGGARERVAGSKFNKEDEFKIAEVYPAKYLIKFLEEEPFAVYTQHYFQNRQGRKLFICCEDCPICAVGHKSSLIAAFNVLVFDAENPDKDPKVKYWRATPAPADEIREFQEGGPINDIDRYAQVYKKKADFNTFHVLEILDTKLERLTGVTPLTEEELEGFKDLMFDESNILSRSSYADLAEVAAELAGAAE